MIKIDFHIHTLETQLDSKSDLKFNLDFLHYYVQTIGLDCIAITNHNCFDEQNFEGIKKKLGSVTVFPGMEVSVNGFHILVICSKKSASILKKLNKYFESGTNNIDIDDFVQLLDSCASDEFILIPHWLKSKSISDVEIEKLNEYIRSGEVANRKQFVRQMKNSNARLIPLLFSDFRPFISDDVKKDEWFNYISNKFTYVNCKSKELKTIKSAVEQKHISVYKSEQKSNEIEFLIDGSTISTGINVVLGTRASGKTWVLNQIEKTFAKNEINYIRQFDITSESQEMIFMENLQKRYVSQYDWLFSNLNAVIGYYKTFDFDLEEKNVDEGLAKLKDYANRSQDADIFSKTKWFQETKFDLPKNSGTNLLKAIYVLKTNQWHKDIISKYLSDDNLANLYIDIERLWKQDELQLILKRKINTLIPKIRNVLSNNSSIEAPDDINFKELFIHDKIILQNETVFQNLRNEKIIDEKNIDDFKLLVTRVSFASASAMKNYAGIKIAMADAYRFYKNNNFYKFVKYCFGNDINAAQITKTIFQVKVEIKNRNNEQLSGGERALFILLNRISDMGGKEILIVDEPEPAFDNPFIYEKIIPLLEAQANIGKTVCVSTHNSSLGMLLNANKIIFCKLNDGKHEIYYGEHANNEFKSITGKKINGYETIIKIMESGKQPYNKKGERYENFKNR